MHKMRALESDWFYHQCPQYLKGGKVLLWDNPDEVYSAIQINVRNLGEIEPFTRYRLMVRRHVPVETLGLPLKFKVIGSVPLNPGAYTGYQREIFNNVGEEVKTGDLLAETEDVRGGFCGGHAGCECERCAPKVIERHILSEIFPAIMYGFGNTATMDDIMLHGNEPRPFIELYVNDRGEFVIMPYCHEPKRRERGIVIKDVEVTTMPFTAKTLQIERNMTEFTRPRSHRSGELFVQGAFCGSHMNRGYNGARSFTGW
jgi:hypothetical protein